MNSVTSSQTSPRRMIFSGLFVVLSVLLMSTGVGVQATPANRAGLSKYYGRFLVRRLDNCTTCHQALPPGKAPTSLADFPHNPFGNRLRIVGEDLRRTGKKADLTTRLRTIAGEDSDKDGVDNQTELLLGHAPGDPSDKPSMAELAQAPTRRGQFARFLASYRWEPFETVHRPAPPKVKNIAWVRNPVDSFLLAEMETRGLHPRPPASKRVLLRRVYLDLTGLAPTPEELRTFEADTSPNAYEKVVDRLLSSPRYGERWGRHWMDVWRYSDWAGWGDQVRDSKPHIWRWRDWIVESLNRDKGYDRMLLEMLAADELCPEDTDALRATGFLVRNFKLLSREQWLEDTVTHTSKAFMGITVGCARCHDHMYDPISQQEYYQMRAIFEPHNVRTDRIPGQADIAKDGLVHAFDADLKVPTYFFIRGDERNPDKSHVIEAGTPASLGGTFSVQAVHLSPLASHPDHRGFVVQETLAASDQAVTETRADWEKAQGETGATEDRKQIARQKWVAAMARHGALLAVLAAEKLEDTDQRNTDAWKQAATLAMESQRKADAEEARLRLLTTRTARVAAQAEVERLVKSADKADKAAAKAAADLVTAKKNEEEAIKAAEQSEAALKSTPTTAYKPRTTNNYPEESTGRRLAFARWLIDAKNPLTARVAVNHIWARHFGQGLVPSLSDFGRNGRVPSHPQLLDWLASEFIRQEWSMKKLHRLLVTGNAYRMASTPDVADSKIDPDDVYLWRMPSRRMEAEVVRDNLLSVSGQLDLTMGGPEIDHNLGLTSKRRSLYLRIAAEKEVEFLKIFDSASVTECYERKQTVMPQQALALANSELAREQARLLAAELRKQSGQDAGKFIQAAFLRILSRPPTKQEIALCADFLAKQTPSTATVALVQGKPEGKPSSDRAYENLTLVLFNHSDFVTIR